MTAELNQENYKEVLDCDIKLTQKLVVDEIKHGFPEELDKYFTSSRLKSNFLTIKENGFKILKIWKIYLHFPEKSLGSAEPDSIK